MSTHRLVGGYQLSDGRLLCGCGSDRCIRLPEGNDPCPLLGEFAKREPAQEYAHRAVAEIRELFEAGAAWLAAGTSRTALRALQVFTSHVAELPCSSPCEPGDPCLSCWARALTGGQTKGLPPASPAFAEAWSALCAPSSPCKPVAREVNVGAPSAVPEIPAMFCEHANEAPGACPCPSNCYCKSHTCRPRPAPAPAPAPLEVINAARVFMGYPRVQSIVEHEADIARRRR